jgi:signal transduction histidine kinase
MLLEVHGQLLVEKLQSSEEQLLESQAIAQVGSFIWNLEDPIIQFSPQLRRILENEKVQTLMEFLQDVLEEDRDRLEDEFRKSLESGVFECECRYQISNKTKILCTRAVIEIKNGKPIMMRGTVQDISAWKEIENEIVRRSVDLNESNIRLQHFAATVSHDLKEPLRKVSTYASFINSKDKDHLSAKSQDFLRKILSATDHMGRLIDNLLAYALLDNNGQGSYCSLQQILEEVIESLELKVKETEAEILSDGLPYAFVIPFQIQLLFQNLISNALKFCKKDEKPVILISHSLSDPGSYFYEKRALSIEFTDNCIGFKNIHFNKIFDPFYRAHDKASFEGTGLGLAICRKVVENHNGTISVTSEENKGSTFKIVLPLEN